MFLYLHSTLENVLPKPCFQEDKTFGNALQRNDVEWAVVTLTPCLLSTISKIKDHHYSQTACDRKIGRKGQENVRNQVQV